MDYNLYHPTHVKDFLTSILDATSDSGEKNILKHMFSHMLDKHFSPFFAEIVYSHLLFYVFRHPIQMKSTSRVAPLKRCSSLTRPSVNGVHQ